MNEHPILFSGEMVRAILEGRKTQTRRVVKLPNVENIVAVEVVDKPLGAYFNWAKGGNVASIPCPYGAPGDHLWVRETWQPHPDAGVDFVSVRVPYDAVVYAADCSLEDYRDSKPWKPSIFMPRWASRITLEITNVRVERLQDIGYLDVMKEGAPLLFYPHHQENKQSDALFDWYKQLWDSINAKRATWESNPWVWVIEFKRVP